MKKMMILFVSLLFGSFSLFAQTTPKKDAKMEKMSKMDDGVMMKDGKMMMVENGKKMEMTHDVTLKNGQVVMQDGTVKMKDGKTMMMKDGDCLSMNGKMSKMKMDKMSKKIKK